MAVLWNVAGCSLLVILTDILEGLFSSLYDQSCSTEKMKYAFRQFCCVLDYFDGSAVSGPVLPALLSLRFLSFCLR